MGKLIYTLNASLDGFIETRDHYLKAEAERLTLEGALPEQVDAALREFGMPMGALQMHDLAGLDVSYKSRKDRDPESFDARVWRSADLLVEMGRLGQKTQAGYYDYAPGDRSLRRGNHRSGRNRTSLSGKCHRLRWRARLAGSSLQARAPPESGRRLRPP